MTTSLTAPSAKSGLPPGSLIHVGTLSATASRVTLIRYDAGSYTEQPVATIDEILQHRTPGATLWVHCEGLNIIGLIEAIGVHFNVHPLVLEDILNTHQRPKFEEEETYLFVVLKTLRCDRSLAVDMEQISLLVFADILFTFREYSDELFDPVKLRLKTGKGRIRQMGPDYLAYVLMDTIVDNYFSLADTLEEAMEAAEITLLDRPQPQTFTTIQRLKRAMVLIRKAITPLREVLLAIQRSESPLIHPRTQPYFRDVFDHILRVIDTMDSARDLLNGMLEIYLSSVSNRMNEIMKVLTVFATIFIPLTFIAGVYGMNFDYMPELHWRWSYPLLWLFFLTVTTGLLIAFRKKRWL